MVSLTYHLYHKRSSFISIYVYIYTYICVRLDLLWRTLLHIMPLLQLRQTIARRNENELLVE